MPNNQAAISRPKPKVKTIIIFPYAGYENNKKCEWYFWWTVDLCRTMDPKPIVALSRDTVVRNQAVSFLKDERTKTLEVIETWSVNTCQTWVVGWGHVLDNYPDCERIITLPGDIEFVDEDQAFYENLKHFVELDDSDITIGDFRTGGRSSAKSLVDIYGTYCLLANWFPEISKNIQTFPLNRPRSEFLNIKTSVMKDLLINHRKFATEQTLNILIKSWNHIENNWRYKFSIMLLGTLSDIRSFRDYRGCIDQIERIEGMLTLLWREIKEPKKTESISDKQFEEQYSRFSDEYDKLLAKSKGVMETARTTLRALLGVYPLAHHPVSADQNRDRAKKTRK